MKRSIKERGVALVITLIFLSVITVLAVAVLALSRRGRAAVRETTNRTTSEIMADMALERVKGEMLGRVLSQATPDRLGPGLLVSRNFLTISNFYTNIFTELLLNPVEVDKIAELNIDARAPVWVSMNRQGPKGYQDFRFYVDLNRNGRYEPTGLIPVVDDAGFPVLDAAGLQVVERCVGDPQYIGVLQDPTRKHSKDNRFIGRYAFLVVPSGRTLDVNRVHNNVKPLVPVSGFSRNQGFGPWEINLGAFLTDLNTNIWNPPGFSYNYIPDPGIPSSGAGFVVATELVNHRYMTNNAFLLTINQLYPRAGPEFATDNIDGYGNSLPVPLGIGYSPENDDPDQPWPGAPNNTNFYTLHDFFDAARFPFFEQSMNLVSRSNSTYNRYTFYRMLSQLGTDSAPDPTPKINPNYINVPANGLVAQRQDGGGNPIHHSATNFLSWTPGELFNNMANRVLHDEFAFGITNIPIFTNGSSRFIVGTNNNIAGYTNVALYHPRVHQLLQLCANVCDSTRGSKDVEAFPFLPTVFEPVMERLANGDIYIRGYTELDGALFYAKLGAGSMKWHNLRDQADHPAAIVPGLNFFYEVPLVIGAKQGLPNFNEFVLQSDVQVSRKLEFRKIQLSAKPSETNQLFIMGISNSFAIEAWYSSTNNTPTNYYPRELQMFAAVSLTTALTNDVGFVGIETNSTNYGFLVITNNTWGGRFGEKEQFRFPGISSQIVITNSAYYTAPAPHFEPLGFTNRFERNQSNFTNHWTMHLTNRVLYFLFDTEASGGPHLVDAVSLNGLDTEFDISGELNRRSANQLENTWDIRPYRNVSVGVNNQIQISLGNIDIQADWTGYGVGNPGNGQSKFKAIDGFRYFMDPEQKIFPLLYYSTNDLAPLGLAFQAPFSPSKKIIQTVSWQANDPLVHYTVDDLQDGTDSNKDVQSLIPRQQSVSLTRDFNLTKLNDRYKPWGGRYGSGANASSDTGQYDLSTRDPGMWNGDHWNFPQQKLANIGWLGRVHRGTPWQSIYLKSEPASAGQWLRPNGPGIDITMHPTNDWRLLNHFTVALSPEMTQGRLSINQTNLAAWSAVLAGLPATTLMEDGNGNAYQNDVTIEPAAIDVANGLPAIPLMEIVAGIARERRRMPDREFHQLGDILCTPELSVQSPYLNAPYAIQTAVDQRDFLVTDADMERIPQQILSLLQVGQPRFVVYAFGQSLIPEDVARSGSQFGMPVNYRITGEVSTRAVVRIDYARLSNDPENPLYHQFDYTQPRAVVERFNLLPQF